jgi:hypothetical protein
MRLARRAIRPALLRLVTGNPDTCGAALAALSGLRVVGTKAALVSALKRADQSENRLGLTSAKALA